MDDDTGEDSRKLREEILLLWDELRSFYDRITSLEQKVKYLAGLIEELEKKSDTRAARMGQNKREHQA